MRLQQLLLVTAVLWAELGGGVEAKKKSRSLKKEQDGAAEPKAARPGAPVVRHRTVQLAPPPSACRAQPRDLCPR
jgi:hypothetical protein